MLIDTEDADIGDVMMAAGIHAARDVEREFAKIVQVVEIVKTRLYGVGDRHRAGVGQRAKVAAGAADHVGQQPDVGGGESVHVGGGPQRVQVAAAHVRQNQVLFVADAQFAETETVGKIGGRFHLRVANIAGCLPRCFQ